MHLNLLLRALWVFFVIVVNTFFQVIFSHSVNDLFLIKICRHLRNHNILIKCLHSFLFLKVSKCFYIALYNINENIRKKLQMPIYFKLKLGSKGLKQAEYFNNRTEHWTVPKQCLISHLIILIIIHQKNNASFIGSKNTYENNLTWYIAVPYIIDSLK